MKKLALVAIAVTALIASAPAAGIAAPGGHGGASVTGSHGGSGSHGGFHGGSVGRGGSGFYGGHGGYGGRGWYGGHGWRGGHGWHGGYGWHRGRWGANFVFDPWWYPWWGWPYYPYPYYYPYNSPPVVVEPQEPDTYMEQSGPPASEDDYWYYCRDPKGYYPYVKKCPNGWMKVVPPSESQDEEE